MSAYGGCEGDYFGDFDIYESKPMSEQDTQVGSRAVVDYKLEVEYSQECFGKDRKETVRHFVKVPQSATPVYVIGRRRRNEGIYHSGCSVVYDWYGKESHGQPWFETVNAVDIAVVTEGLRYRPYEVLWEDICEKN